MGGEAFPFPRAQRTFDLQETSRDPWSRSDSKMDRRTKKNPQVKGPKPAVLCCVRHTILLQDTRNFCTIFAPPGPAWSHLFCVPVQKTHRQQGRDSLASLLIYHFHFFSKQPMGRNPVLLGDDLQQWEQCQHYLCF